MTRQDIRSHSRSSNFLLSFFLLLFFLDAQLHINAATIPKSHLSYYTKREIPARVAAEPEAALKQENNHHTENPSVPPAQQMQLQPELPNPSKLLELLELLRPPEYAPPSVPELKPVDQTEAGPSPRPAPPRRAPPLGVMNGSNLKRR